MSQVVTVKDICEFMENLAPKSLAQAWDNVGLMVGNRDAVVEKIMVALDLTPDVLAQARAEKVDMIITHHPFVFRPLSNIVTSDVQPNIYWATIQAGIAVYSAHTNLDATYGGVNDVLAQVLELEIVGKLHLDEEDQAGIGRYGVLSKPKAVKTFIKNVKDKMDLPIVTYASDNLEVFKVAIVGGAGSDAIDAAVAIGADTLITGDVKYHAAQEAVAKGLTIVDITHQLGEIVIVSAVARYLQLWLTEKELECVVLEAQEKQLLQYY